MIVFREVTPRRKELFQTLVPLVQLYKSGAASSKAVADFIERMASALERMGYSPKEISDIDKKTFLDIVKEWRGFASAEDIMLIKAVFQF